MLPHYKVDMNVITSRNFSTLCSGEEERKDVKKCIESKRYHHHACLQLIIFFTYLSLITAGSSWRT